MREQKLEAAGSSVLLFLLLAAAGVWQSRSHSLEKNKIKLDIEGREKKKNNSTFKYLKFWFFYHHPPKQALCPQPNSWWKTTNQHFVLWMKPPKSKYFGVGITWISIRRGEEGAPWNLLNFSCSWGAFPGSSVDVHLQPLTQQFCALFGWLFGFFSLFQGFFFPFQAQVSVGADTDSQVYGKHLPHQPCLGF